MIYVVGGGVSGIQNPAYPAAVSLSVAIGAELELSELGVEQTVLSVLRDSEDPTQLAQSETRVTVLAPNGPDGLADVIRPTAYVVADFRNVAVPKPGYYSIDISLNGSLAQRIFFIAAKVPGGVVEPGEREPSPG